jgi:hypothetical protein
MSCKNGLGGGSRNQVFGCPRNRARGLKQTTMVWLLTLDEGNVRDVLVLSLLALVGWECP